MNAIVVGVDQSMTARWAAQRAAEIAEETGRPLHLVMALSETAVRDIRTVGSDHYRLDPFGVADHWLRALAGELASKGPVTTAVVVNDPAAALCEEAVKVDASIIVVGNKGVQRSPRLGRSIAGDVAKGAPCDVLVVHTYNGRRPCVAGVGAAAGVLGIADRS